MFLQKTISAIVLFSTVVAFTSCKKESITELALTPNSGQNLTELRSIHLGLYIDNGAGGIYEVKSMLNQLGCSYSTITKDTILISKLSNYDVILFPGGNMWVYKSHLSACSYSKVYTPSK